MNTDRRVVLIVDDEASIRWSLGEAFADAGYQIQEACDARQALEQFQGNDHADIVLLDLKVPGTTGLDLLTSVRQAAPNVPVILMTAHATEDLTAEALQAGASRVVMKPFDLDEIVTLSHCLLATDRS